MNINTLCIHGNNNKANPTGSVSVPIYQSATFAHPGVGQSTGYDYSRLQNPTREQLELLVANLESGYDAMAFSTGMAAIACVMELFSPGDHIIVSDDLYGGAHRLFHHISVKNGLLFTYINTSNLDLVKGAITANTKALFVETPTNPMMQVSDIRKLSAIAKEINAYLIVDNTFLTPYFQKPISLGANIVIHSGTKFLSGHNDTLSGFIVTDSKDLSDKLRFIYKTTGACLSPFDSWLVIRGIKTLAIRMERQQETALALASWLLTEPKIKAVHYVGLPSHPDYHISKSQSSGFSSMIAFEVDTQETAKTLLTKVKMILYAESLGGVESLITYPMKQTHADVPKEERESRGITDTLLRMSVGLEDFMDIKNDLKQALS